MVKAASGISALMNLTAVEIEAPFLPELSTAEIKPEPKVEVATVPDALDFDLGGLGFEASPPLEAKHAQAPVDIKVDFGGMELDHISASPVNEHAFTLASVPALQESRWILWCEFDGTIANRNCNDRIDSEIYFPQTIMNTIKLS